ncbi:MAG: hypothetical protein ACKVP7_27775 [Hyphomicrobiaceae bacterium]
MTLDPTIVADVLVNVFGAAGALVLSREIHRADPFGPVVKRIVFALRFIGMFFLLRALSWATGAPITAHAVDVLATATPLVSLIVAEGLMRRHAPRGLKLFALGAPVSMLLVKLLPGVPVGIVSGLMLAGVFGGFLGVAAFLWSRTATDLTGAENANIGRVLLALLVLAPLILTDFRSVWPEIPVRLGAVGALLLLYLSFGTGNLQASAVTRVGTIAVFAVIAVVLSFGYTATGGNAGTAHFVRVAMVGFSGLLLAAIISEARGAASERTRTNTAVLSAVSPQTFEAGLREHPLLGGARLLTGAALDHVRDGAFDALLADNAVLRRSAAPWGRSPDDGGVERALSLMIAHDATDLAVLTRSPLRLMLFSLPAVSRDAKSDADIQLVRLVGELAFTKADRA